MSFPEPVPGLVIRYSYLWHAEHLRGREEGLKDRPCAIVLTTASEDASLRITVLPVTRTPPSEPHLAVEIPATVKRRLGLDDNRSWVMLNEANRFVWPGPDLRPSRASNAKSVVYGALPYRLFETIRLRFIAAVKERRSSLVQRSE